MLKTFGTALQRLRPIFVASERCDEWVIISRPYSAASGESMSCISMNIDFPRKQVYVRPCPHRPYYEMYVWTCIIVVANIVILC